MGVMVLVVVAQLGMYPIIQMNDCIVKIIFCHKLSLASLDLSSNFTPTTKKRSTKSLNFVKRTL